jgi:hypothetical protein
LPTAITIQPSSSEAHDSYVFQANPDINYSNQDELYAGLNGSTSTTYRTFIKFPTTAIPAGAGVSTAYLSLYCHTAASTSGYAINLQQPTTGWDDTSVTWNNQPAVSTSVIAATTVGGAVAWYDWPAIEDIVRRWHASDTDNDGLRLAGDESATSVGLWKRFRSADSTSTNKPKITLSYTNAPSITAISPTGTISAPTTFNNTVQPALSALYTQSTDTSDMAYRWDRVYDMAGNLLFNSTKTASTAVSGSTVSTTMPLGYLRYGNKYKWVCRLYDGFGGYAESTAYFICKLTTTPAATDLAAGNHLYAMSTSGRIVALEEGAVDIASTSPWSWDVTFPVLVKNPVDWTESEKVLEYVKIAYEPLSTSTRWAGSVEYSNSLGGNSTSDFLSAQALSTSTTLQVVKIHCPTAEGEERVSYWHRIKLSGTDRTRIYAVEPQYRETERST